MFCVFCELVLTLFSVFRKSCSYPKSYVASSAEATCLFPLDSLLRSTTYNLQPDSSRTIQEQVGTSDSLTAAVVFQSILLGWNRKQSPTVMWIGFSLEHPGRYWWKTFIASSVLHMETNPMMLWQRRRVEHCSRVPGSTCSGHHLQELSTPSAFLIVDCLEVVASVELK